MRRTLMGKMVETIEIGKGDALIIVDGQIGFIAPDGGLYVAGIEGEQENEDILHIIHWLSSMEYFSWIATSEDDHPKKHIEHEIFGTHCVHGSEDQKYHEGLLETYKKANEHIIKGRDKNIISLSISTSPDFPRHIANLRKKKIKRVFIVGWAYTHCVGESAIDYAIQGFETYVIRDATRSVPLPHGNSNVMTVKLIQYGVKLITTSQIK